MKEIIICYLGRDKGLVRNDRAVGFLEKIETGPADFSGRISLAML